MTQAFKKGKNLYVFNKVERDFVPLRVFTTDVGDTLLLVPNRKKGNDHRLSSVVREAPAHICANISYRNLIYPSVL